MLHGLILTHFFYLMGNNISHTKILLDESELANVIATPPAPYLGPSGQAVNPEKMAAIFLFRPAC